MEHSLAGPKPVVSPFDYVASVICVPQRKPCRVSVAQDACVAVAQHLLSDMAASAADCLIVVASVYVPTVPQGTRCNACVGTVVSAVGNYTVLSLVVSS